MFKVEIRGSVEKYTDDLQERVHEATKGGLLLAAQIASGHLRQVVTETFKPGRGGAGLAGSFMPSMLQPKDGKLRSGALSDLVYARIQDEGGQITPKNVKALVIPVSAEAKAFSGRGAGSFKDFPGGLHLVWPRGWDRGWLEDEAGKIHALLRRSVNLPGKRYLDKAATRARKDIEAAIDKTMTVETKKAKT